ncbi:MAG: hypothetical protein QOE53_1755, partial [Pseudonocardiales bacterium]|nr:hypothetical protein [Pseudonocardiales bacterium]
MTISASRYVRRLGIHTSVLALLVSGLVAVAPSAAEAARPTPLRPAAAGTAAPAPKAGPVRGAPQAAKGVRRSVPGATSVNWLHLGKPTAIAANGISRLAARQPAAPAATGRLLPVRTASTAPAVTHPVPLVRGPDWNVQYAAGPNERTGASMALDTAGAAPVDVMFGGLTRMGRSWSATNETWTWDGTAWSFQSPTTSPSGRAGAMMAYDPALGTVIVYGGWSGISGTLYSVTWAWNGTTWTQLSPTSSPGPQAFGSMVYDTALGKLVLFGGASAVGQSPAFAAAGGSWAAPPPASNQTWTFDGATWTQLSPATSPSARSSAAAGYDPVSGTVVLYGGFSPAGTTLGDTWTFDGATWSMQSPANSPVGVSDAAMAYDSTLKSLVLFGGANSAGSPTNVTSFWDSVQHSWIWNFNDVTAAAREGMAMAPAAGNGQLALFSGEFAAQSLASDTQIFDWGQRGSGTGNQTRSFTVDDQLSLSVDLGSGNLFVKQQGIRLAGTNQVLDNSAQYNSQYPGTEWMDSPWHETLRFGPSGSMEIDGVGGADDSLAFYADGSGGFTSPPDLNATLSYVAASANYELIFAAPSQQIVWFNSPADDGSGTPGLVSAVTDHNGDQTTITGDLTTGNATLVDSRGRTITRTQSSSGATWAYPDGRSWTEGARVGRSQSFTDASGGVTSYGYNAGNGKLTSIVDPAGHITAIDYNFDGKVASISQGPGGGPYTSVTQFNWGPVSAGTAVPPGSTAQSETQVTDTNGHLSRYVNKYNGQTITTMGPFAHPTSAVYNSNDLPTSQTDANGHTTSATYSATVVTDQTSMTAPPSATGQTPATTSAAYNTSSTVLDYQHLPSAATDAEGNCTARVYDAAGHLTDSYAGQTTPCDGHTAGIHLANRYQGDAGVPSCGGMAGQLCSSTSGNGQSTTYSYDSAGNQLTVTPPAPQHNTAYTYDSSSRIATVVDGSGTRSYSYDNNDRVTQIRYAGASTCTPSAGTCITYSYDANGNRTQMVDASGTSSWTYDAMNRVTKEISPTAPVNSCSSPADSGIVHVYDDLGNQISSCDSTGTTNYAYDSEGRLLATAAPITQVGLANAMLCSGCKIDYPVATRPGDQIVVGVTSAAGSSVSTPTGWTLVGAYTAGSTIETILTRIAVSGDTYVTLSSSTFSSMAVTLGVYRGLSTSTPIEAVSAAGTSGTALTVPGVTTTAAADKLLLFAGVTGAVTGDVTPGGGLVVDQGVIAHTGAMTATLSSAWLTKSGATGSVSAG